MKREQLTVAQAAARRGIAPGTWRAYVARGQAPAPDGHWPCGCPWWWDTGIPDAKKRPAQP